MYRLPAGASDSQTPHGEEEIYFVVSGRAQFKSGASNAEVKTGDVLFVLANEAHHFHSILEELELLVFFAPAESST